jgi:hypothetical protein
MKVSLGIDQRAWGIEKIQNLSLYAVDLQMLRTVL